MKPDVRIYIYNFSIPFVHLSIENVFLYPFSQITTKANGQNRDWDSVYVKTVYLNLHIKKAVYKGNARLNKEIVILEIRA